MTTRIVHIGDVHLQKAHPRNGDRLNALDQIVRETRAMDRVGLIAGPGDWFHAKSTIEDRNELTPRLIALAAIAPLVWVRGNHDAEGDAEIFAKLQTVWPIYVVTRPSVLIIPTPTGETFAVAAVPYPDKAGLVSVGVATADVPQTAAQLLDAIFMQLAHELEVPRISGAIPVFFGHFNVRGATASTGQPQIGTEQEIDRLSLERLPVVYCGLNHIHKPQEVGSGVYAGSIAAMDHGETEAKSYVVVNCARLADGGWSADWTRQPIATPPMFHIDGRLTRDAFTWQLARGQEMPRDGAAIDWTGTDLRVRVSYKASERSVLDFDRVRAEFAGALRLKVEGVAEPDRELRAPAVAAARTLPEKLAAYRKETQLPPSVAAKLALLETLDSIELCGRVGLQLRAIEQPENAAVAA